MSKNSNCVFHILNRCDGVDCANCQFYETYDDWDNCDSLVMEMQDLCEL